MTQLKELYWLIENNAELSVTVKDISDAKGIIETNFNYETEGGKFEIDDLQYTVKPVMLTQKEFEDLGEEN